VEIVCFLLDTGNGILAAFFTPPGDNNGHAPLSQRHRGRLADARRCAGDEEDFIFHGVLLNREARKAREDF
jgi:hypothetical protein